MSKPLCRLLVFSVLFGCLASSAAAGQTDPANPPQGVFVDDWYVIKLGGQQAGYVHSTMERRANHIRTDTETLLALKRAGRTIEVKIRSGTTESLEGTPLSFDGRMNLATVESQFRGKIANGKVRLTTTQFGVSNESEFGLPPGALMSWGLRLAGLEHGFEPGTKYTVNVYEPSQSPGAAIPTTVEITGRETIGLFGKKYDAIKGRVTASLGGMEIPSEVWTDEQGDVLRSELQMMGLKMEQLLADKERALNWDVSAELMIDTLVRPDRPIDSRKARRIRYRLTLSESEHNLGDLPTTGMQKVLRAEGRSAELLVQRQDHQALARQAGKLAKPTANLKQYLAAGPLINWRDPEVLKMAAEAKGDETNAYRLADKLRRYVTEVIEEKNLDVGFATASEAARNREGDCSEHGVLLAALGRANGIPSRVVCGLIYVDEFLGREAVFGFHMWTQMYIAGQWVDLDAAMRETDCNPTHIALATSSLQDEGLLELVGPLLKVIGNLKIEVLETEP